jgi:hypothetical protein
MYVRNSIPGDGPGMLGHDHLKLSLYDIEKMGQGCENPTHALDVG